MKHRLIVLVVGLLFAAPSFAVEKDWKGPSPETDFTFGTMAGGGVIDSTVGFGIPITLSKKILNRGFAPDMNNQVFLELYGGPLFISGGTAFQYSLHLRWDFLKDTEWGFYGGAFGETWCTRPSIETVARIPRPRSCVA